MSYKVKVWPMVLLTMLLSLKVLIILISAEPQVPCYFIFGDSLVDNGNNNLLETEAKVNYLPYGIDFRDGPTGRFTNGRNSADILGELLGFNNYIPPFATARGQDILKGVNYASGGSGIRFETGENLGERISLDQQLSNHGTTTSSITGLQGNNESSAKEYLSKCLYTVGSGSNDYINNYLMPAFYSTRSQYTPDEFAAELIQQYRQQLKTLYNYGARKVAVFGLGPIGCIPQEVANYGANASGCVDFINDEVQLFNSRIKPLVDELNTNLPNAHYTYINVSNISPSIVAGILNIPCCQVSTTVGEGQCVPNRTPCHTRVLRVFWDNFHPTETGHTVIAGRSYIALSPLDAYPIDIRHLARL